MDWLLSADYQLLRSNKWMTYYLPRIVKYYCWDLQALQSPKIPLNTGLRTVLQTYCMLWLTAFQNLLPSLMGLCVLFISQVMTQCQVSAWVFPKYLTFFQASSKFSVFCTNSRFIPVFTWPFRRLCKIHIHRPHICKIKFKDFILSACVIQMVHSLAVHWLELSIYFSSLPKVGF